MSTNNIRASLCTYHNNVTERGKLNTLLCELEYALMR